MTVQYRELAAQLKSLTDGVPYAVTNTANAASLIYNSLERVSWVGFYFMLDGALRLGPFMGKPACVRIETGRGVCGTSFAENRIVRVPDVHEYPGHIACDSASESEIVLPLHNNAGEVIAVLDLDSPVKSRFTDDDETGLAEIARIIEKLL